MNKIITGPRGRAREIYEAVIALLHEHGITEHELCHASQHYQLKIPLNGKVRCVTLSVSPRSKNAVHMKLGDVRRLLRNEGIIT